MPIVEPEVLMDGSHTIERCEEVTGNVLHVVFNALFEQKVSLEGMLLKPNMVISGMKCAKQATVEEVALATAALSQPARAGRGPRDRFLVRRPESPRRHRASERHQSARGAKALEAQLFVWARVAGRSAQGLAGKERKPQSRPTGVLSSGQVRQRGRPGQIFRRHGERIGRLNEVVSRAARFMRKESEDDMENPLTSKELELMNAYWRACNYLSVGMIYLKDNPLLKEPLKTEDVKHRLLGHWGASPALSFVWVHLNRMIVKHDLDVIFVAGPGHGAPGVLGPAYLEGTYSEIYPDKSEDAEGMQKFFKQFSFPGHIGSHVTPETPGSIHEGGELGYSLSHAYGMALDNPDLIVACVVGDGEAETGPLATAWHSNKFINPVRDGAVLPILNLNGYKIANPTILSRISHEELEALFVGYGYKPYFVEGDDPAADASKDGRHVGRGDRRDPRPAENRAANRKTPSARAGR